MVSEPGLQQWASMGQEGATNRGCISFFPTGISGRLVKFKRKWSKCGAVGPLAGKTSAIVEELGRRNFSIAEALSESMPDGLVWRKPRKVRLSVPHRNN